MNFNLGLDKGRYRIDFTLDGNQYDSIPVHPMSLPLKIFCGECYSIGSKNDKTYFKFVPLEDV